MDFFIPRHVKGRFATADQKAAAEAAGRDPSTVGRPYQFFRGIHHIPDDIANSYEANALGIVPVEEMGDDDWRLLGLNRVAWMKANRPEATAEAPEKPAQPGPVPDVVVAAPAQKTPSVNAAAPMAAVPTTAARVGAPLPSAAPVAPAAPIAKPAA